MPFDVFLSYAPQDQPAVIGLAEALENRRLSVWLDEWELVPGQTVMDKIEHIIAVCPSAAVCLGADLESWQNSERQALLNRFNTEQDLQNPFRLIPILLPGAKQPLPSFLANFKWVDLRRGVNEEQLDQIQWGITGIRPRPSTEPPPNFPHNLPFRSIGDLFKGREEALRRVGEMLADDSSSATAITAAQLIHGLGGVGKTRLAVEYAWRNADRYAALLFVGADSPEGLQAGLAGLCRVLNLPQQETREQYLQVQAALAWLAARDDWLLILDNVDDEEAAAAVQTLAEELYGGSVLLTGRWSRFGRSIAKTSLDVLAPAEAAEYLLAATEEQRKRTSDEAADALELAQRLDCLAVALEHAGAYVVANRCSLAQYQKAWQENLETVAAWYDRLTLNYPRSVLAAWATTMDKVSEEAKRLLELLSWLAPAPLPDFFLEPQRNAANELADYSMLTWDRDADAWRVHRVVQEVARSRIEEPRRAESVRAAVQTVEDAAPEEIPSDVRTWTFWAPMEEHATAAAEHADRHDVCEPTASLMGGLGVFLSGKALHSQAERLERRAWELDAITHGEQSPQVAIRLNNLAQTLQATNRLSEAEPLMRRALDIDEQAFGNKHPKVAIRLNNLALLLKATNRLSEAEPLLFRQIEIDVLFGSSTGHEHPDLEADIQLHRNVCLFLNLPPSEIENRLQSALSAQEPLAPITPEVERLLGPAEPVSAAELDRRLGPAPPVREVLAELDRQYREQGKPPVWFLPLDEPIGPHLDELLGPPDAGE